MREQLADEQINTTQWILAACIPTKYLQKGQEQTPYEIKNLLPSLGSGDHEQTMTLITLAPSKPMLKGTSSDFLLRRTWERWGVAMSLRPWDSGRDLFPGILGLLGAQPKTCSQLSFSGISLKPRVRDILTQVNSLKVSFLSSWNPHLTSPPPRRSFCSSTSWQLIPSTRLLSVIIIKKTIREGSQN